MKKRILSIILAALMVIGTFAIGTAAAGEFKIVAETSDNGNGTYDVDVMMYNCPRISGLDLAIKFDNSKVKLVNYEGYNPENWAYDPTSCLSGTTSNLSTGNALDTFTEVTLILARAGVDPTVNGKLLGLTFKLEDGVKNADIEVVVKKPCIQQATQNAEKLEFTPVTENGFVGVLTFDELILEDKTVTFDGEAHSLEIKGVDDTMNVQWTNNGKKDAGTYTVTAVVSKAGYESKTLTATLTINKANAYVTNVELWPVVEGEIPEIKSLENAQVEIPGVMGWDLVVTDPAVVKDGDVYKLTGVSAPTNNVILDTTITFTPVAEEALVDAVIEAAEIDTDMPVDPRVSKIPALDVELPYGYELELVANGVVAADGSFEKTEEEQIVPVTYNVVDASGAKVGEVVVTYTIPRQAKGSDLAMLLLYYHKLMDEKNQGTTVKPTTPVVETSVTLKADAANIKYLEGRGDKFEPTAHATRYEVIKAIANLFDIKTNNDPLALTDVADEYKELVDLCTAAGIIKGYEDKTFRGDDSITRAEIATMICNVMKLDVASAKDAGFKDVSGWATNYVNACANAGYVQGKGDGEFAPSENITRAELATLFNNITGAKAGTSCSYADVDADAWYFGYVAAAAK